MLRVIGHLRTLSTAPRQPHPTGTRGRGALDALHSGQGCVMGPGWAPLPCHAGGGALVLQQLETAGQVGQDQPLSVPGPITALHMESWSPKSKQDHTF